MISSILDEVTQRFIIYGRVSLDGGIIGNIGIREFYSQDLRNFQELPNGFTPLLSSPFQPVDIDNNFLPGKDLYQWNEYTS